MYRTVPLIAQRLAAALGPGWAIGHGNAAQDRLPLPRADVRLVGAALQDAKARAVHLQATYRIALVVEGSHPGNAFAAAAADATKVHVKLTGCPGTVKA